MQEELRQSVVPINSTTPSHFSWVLTPGSVALFGISIVGSISIFCLVCLSKTFRRTSNYLVANLCVASSYHIIVSILYNLQSGGVELWEYGQTTCHILAIIHRLPTPVTVLSLAAISVERSVVARNPLDYPSKAIAIGRVLFIWFFSFILLLPRASMNIYDDKIKGGYKCKKVLLWDSVFFHTSYAILTLFVTYIIPTYILVKEYFAMRSQMQFLMKSQVEQKKRFQRRVRVMKNACIFTCIFITCWLPQGITQFPYDLPEEYFFSEQSLSSLVPLRDFFRQLSIFNTCLTPILLLVLSFDIREFLASSCTV